MKPFQASIPTEIFLNRSCFHTWKRTTQAWPKKAPNREHVFCFKVGMSGTWKQWRNSWKSLTGVQATLWKGEVEIQSCVWELATNSDLGMAKFLVELEEFRGNLVSFWLLISSLLKRRECWSVCLNFYKNSKAIYGMPYNVNIFLLVIGEGQ